MMQQKTEQKNRIGTYIFPVNQQMEPYSFDRQQLLFEFKTMCFSEEFTAPTKHAIKMLDQWNQEENTYKGGFKFLLE